MSCCFWPILTSSPSHFVTHPRDPQKYVTHLGRKFLVGLVQKNVDKTPCTNSLLIGFLCRGFCQVVFCLEGFVRGGFCPFPLLSEYICYNRKLNITLNFGIHMYNKKIISVTSHALDLPPPVTNCHTFSYPFPSSVMCFMDGPYM